MDSLDSWITIAEGHHGPALADPEATAANLRQRLAERRRYQLPPARPLAEFRRSLFVSQEDLAGRLGLQQSRLSRFERHQNPRLLALQAYIASLGGTLVLVASLPDRDVSLRIG